MGILDTAFLVGKETTYGTAATLTRGFENKSDDFKDEPEFLESVGFRAGLAAVRSDRRVRINMGGSGSIEVDVLNKGMGLLVQALLGGTTGPTQVASTTAYTQAHTATADGPAVSFTMQWLRAFVDSDGTDVFTYPGSVPTSWSLSQSPDGLLVLNVDVDFQNEETSTSAGTPSYPSSATPFSWPQAVVELDSTAIDCVDFELSADLMMKTDRRYLRGSALKKQPVRTGVPTYEGALNVDFEDADRYDEFKAGSIHDLNVKWSFPDDSIESGHTYEFEVDMPAIQWAGETPEASLTELTRQPLPFKVLHDGSNPPVTINIKSTDTAL